MSFRSRLFGLPCQLAVMASLTACGDDGQPSPSDDDPPSGTGGAASSASATSTSGPASGSSASVGGSGGDSGGAPSASSSSSATSSSSSASGGEGGGGPDLPDFDGPGCIAYVKGGNGILADELWLRGSCAPGGAVNLNTAGEGVDDTDQEIVWSPDGEYLTWLGFQGAFDPPTRRIVHVGDTGIGPMQPIWVNAQFVAGGIVSWSFDELHFQPIAGDIVGSDEVVWVQPYPNGSIDGVSVAPGGSHIALAYSTSDASVEELVLFQASGATVSEIASHPGAWVRFAPNGQSLVIDGNATPDSSFVALANPASSQPLEADYGWNVLWSPDSTAIAYTSSTGLLYTQQLVPTVVAPVAVSGSLAVDDEDFRWSPDSQRLAMIDSGELVVVERDGEGMVTLTSLASSLAWSPDSARIAYQSWDTDLYVIGASGGVAAQVNAGCSVPNINLVNIEERKHDWSPDGSKLAFLCFTASTPIDLLVAPLSDLATGSSITAPELTGLGKIGDTKPRFLGSAAVLAPWYGNDFENMWVLGNLADGSLEKLDGWPVSPRPVGW